MVSRDADEGACEELSRERDRAVMTNGGRSALTAILRCLSDAQRRRVLYYLRERGTATVDELARYLVAHETDRRVADVDSEECEAVETALHHVHLPKLVDALIAEYDSRSETVRYSDPPDELEPFLDFAERIERAEDPPEPDALDRARCDGCDDSADGRDDRSDR